MCGIGAILDPAGTSGQHAAERMVEALRHRGPDGEALRRIGPVALAHTRLAIIDVAGGDQPLDSEDGRVTEIGALLAAGLTEARVDRVALDHYLACRFVPSPRTMFDGIKKLAAAETLV